MKRSHGRHIPPELRRGDLWPLLLLHEGLEWFAELPAAQKLYWLFMAVLVAVNVVIWLHVLDF